MDGEASGGRLEEVVSGVEAGGGEGVGEREEDGAGERDRMVRDEEKKDKDAERGRHLRPLEWSW
ncbi:Amidase domain-containing protein [Psidium guajava]|nr:Amidase domain-containing protein [Psidium guajava]